MKGCASFFLLLSAVFLFCRPLRAQQVVYSAYQKVDNRNGSFGVIGRTGSRIVTYMPGADGYQLDFYNDSMEHEATALLDFFPARVYSLQFIAYPHHIVALYQGIERNRITQYAARLDDRGLLQGRPVVVREEKTGLLGASGAYFKTVTSEDKKLLLIYRLSTDRNTLTLQYNMLSDTLSKVDQGNLTSTGDAPEPASEPLLANDGSIYVGASLASRGATGRLVLLHKMPAAHELVSTDIPMDGHYAGNLIMRADGPGLSLFIAGFYASRSNGLPEGVLFATFQKEPAGMSAVHFLPFGDEVVKASGYRSLRSFSDFDPRQLIIKNDGGFVLIAEDYSVTYRNGGGGGFGYYGGGYYSPFGPGAAVKEYRYEDIMALSYQADGSAVWQNFVRKSQFSQDDEGRFSSYALLNSGGSLAFLYNDFSGNNAKSQLATIDRDGKLSMRSLSGEEDDPDWLINMAQQTGRKELIIPCLRRRQLCFARVEF